MGVRVLIRYLVDDTVQEKKFKGAEISTQLFARDKRDHRGCRAVVIVLDNKGRRVHAWHGACVFTIEKTWER